MVGGAGRGGHCCLGMYVNLASKKAEGWGNGVVVSRKLWAGPGRVRTYTNQCVTSGIGRRMGAGVLRRLGFGQDTGPKRKERKNNATFIATAVCFRLYYLQQGAQKHKNTHMQYNTPKNQRTIRKTTHVGVSPTQKSNKN